MHLLSLLGLLLATLLGGAVAAQEQCSSTPGAAVQEEPAYNYSDVLSSARDAGISFADLPGFTRSVYAADHALIAPESRVWATLPGWKNAPTAHLITPAKGAHFSMYLVQMKKDSEAPPQLPVLSRFVFVIEGEIQVDVDGKTMKLAADHWAYFPPGTTEGFTSSSGAGLLIFERLFALAEGQPKFLHGTVNDSPVLPVAPEVFVLRKLLPQTQDYDFNVHVMDFKPGEYLYIKEVHYNQHGLLLLQGQGIYKLGNNWYSVQAGDAIWMPPFVPQWYAALGRNNSRYILYKDTTMDPHMSL